MKLEVGIGQNQAFYVLRDHKKYGLAIRLYRGEAPEMFIWLTQYLIDHKHDPTKEHEWYEIEL